MEKGLKGHQKEVSKSAGAQSDLDMKWKDSSHIPDFSVLKICLEKRGDIQGPSQGYER